MRKTNKKEYIHKISFINKIILAVIFIFVVSQTNLLKKLYDAFISLFNSDSSSDITEEELDLINKDYETRDGDFEEKLRRMMENVDDSD
tara:strand:+ start:1747 stop:2013 length:267 start_codon:yes stop_codon:yes gene_type:complete